MFKLIVLSYPTSAVLGTPKLCRAKLANIGSNSFILATEKALPPKSKLTLSLALSLDPPKISLFAELEAIVTLPETVISTPPTVAA